MGMGMLFEAEDVKTSINEMERPNRETTKTPKHHLKSCQLGGTTDEEQATCTQSDNLKN